MAFQFTDQPDNVSVIENDNWSVSAAVTGGVGTAVPNDFSSLGYTLFNGSYISTPYTSLPNILAYALPTDGSNQGITIGVYSGVLSNVKIKRRSIGIGPHNLYLTFYKSGVWQLQIVQVYYASNPLAIYTKTGGTVYSGDQTIITESYESTFEVINNNDGTLTVNMYAKISGLYRTVTFPYSDSLEGCEILLSTYAGGVSGDPVTVNEILAFNTIGQPSYDLKLYKSPNTLIDSVTNASGVYNYSESAEIADSGDYYVTATNAGTTIQSNTVAVTVNPALSVTVSPLSVDIIEGNTVLFEATASGTGPFSYSWLLNGSEVSTENQYERVMTLSDTGSMVCRVTNNSGSVDSDQVPIVVRESYQCDDSVIRFLFELSQRNDLDPTLMISTSIQSPVGVISYFETVEKSNNYWTNWGGTYSVGAGRQFELFFETWCNRVSTMDELIADVFTLYQTDSAIYVNLPRYTWQYYREPTFVSTIYGYSSAIKDPHNPSDDRYGGMRYPVRLKVPSLGMAQLPDPVNGVIPLPAFSVSLENSDGFFDNFDQQRVFNSPVRLKKSTKSRPELSDFVTIRTGKIDSVEVSFSEYRIKTFETARAFTMPVCRSITDGMFESADPEVAGKALPVGYGTIRGISLVKIGSGDDDFRYIALDPAYLTEVSAVYNSDGDSIAFTVASGVISCEVSAERADIVGRVPATIADIVVNEISEKAGVAYGSGLWDVSEVERYRNVSPEISLYVNSGNLKKLLELALENDSAFQFTKNNGLLTIRRVGFTYDYHIIPSWKTTQVPSKTFSDSKDFCSSVKVNYEWDYKSNEPDRSFLFDTGESTVFATYTKEQRNEYDTHIAYETSAGDLAERIFNRFSKRFEIVSIGTGYDCSLINVLDTVELPIVINGRSFSSVTKWIVRSVDPAQDKLQLEQYSAVESYIPGTLSFPSVDSENGIASHVSIENESGELANPSIAKGN